MMNGTDTNPENSILAGKRIGMFGKGGSGKSTVVVLLARVLHDRGYEVCVLDADSTNMGLHLALGINRPPESLLDYFGGAVFSGGLVTCPVDDPTLLVGSEIFLDELPPKYYRQNQSGITLLVAGKIGDRGPGAGCDGPVSKIARDVRIGIHGENPVTLVDFKAGFEDTARGVITSLDWAIVIVDPTIAAIEMAINMRDTISQIKYGIPPATQHLESPDLVALAKKLFFEARIKGVQFIFNKIGNVETENYLRAKLADEGIEPSGVVDVDPSITDSWLKGIPLSVKRFQGSMNEVIEKLEAAESLYAGQLSSDRRRNT